MAVSIDPSEVRQRSSSAAPASLRRVRPPLRTVLVGGLGAAGLIAFSVSAFSFFSTLADPRARTAPRITPMASAWPDLKDGIPALTSEAPEAAKPALLNLPRPRAAEVPAQAAAPERSAAAEVEAMPLRTTAVSPPPIQNAATVQPARTAEPLAPARAETVKAKPVQAAGLAPSPAAPEPAREPASTASAAPTPMAAPVRKATPAKPPVQKAAARGRTPAAPAADASEPAPSAPVRSASAASDDGEIPGARQLRAGVKAISGIFGGDAKDE